MVTNTVISNYNIKNLSAGISGNHYDRLGYGGISSGSITAVLGYLDILGSSLPTYSQFQIPGTINYSLITPSSFSKLSLSGNRNQQLTEGGATSLYAAISGQLASTNLNSAEQFYLGGPYGVRAYPVAQSGGSQGGLATIELRHQLRSNIMLSTFFDAGTVQQYKNLYPGWQGLTNANNTYSLFGAGLGLRLELQGWNIGAIVAWKVGSNPLYSQSGQAVNTDGTNTQPRGWLTASYSF
jgi:hemolysin activation/secretion protein